MQKLAGLVRRCADDYSMIQEGDRIAVGLSGGKDSAVLLAALAALRGYYPKKFELFAVTADMGFEGMDLSPLADWCAELGVPYIVEKTEIAKVVFEDRREKNPCALCSKMRRGVINRRLISEGITKLALGHHLDDAIETFFMSLVFEGRISCFSPVSFMDRSGVTQIRPLLYATEAETESAAARLGLPVVKSTCPMDGTSSREDVKGIVAAVSAGQEDFHAKMLGAMQRLPLPGWAPEHHPRTKTRLD